MQWTTEQWQFFAFIFSALATLAFVPVDELPRIAWLPTWSVKTSAFVFLPARRLPNPS